MGEHRNTTSLQELFRTSCRNQRAHGVGQLSKMVFERKRTVFANFQLTHFVPCLKWNELVILTQRTGLDCCPVSLQFFKKIKLKWEIGVLQKFSATWYLYSKIRWVWNTSWLMQLALSCEIWPLWQRHLSWFRTLSKKQKRDLACGGLPAFVFC